ncbi:MAG TPA: hypothetical protein VN705_07710 [Steroidobacteraceae bacterium]|nr:hypothetical protein [Steroidobacteraceae bacterium]
METSLLCRKSPRRLVTPQLTSPQFISPAILFAALLAAGTASAENWEIAPRVEAGYRYSDNWHLGPPGTEVEVSGGETDAQVAFRTLDPRTQIEITPRILATYFPDAQDDDSVDGYLDGRFEDVTPRRRMGVTGSFAHETVTRSELPEGGDVGGGDLGNPATGDSGRFIEHNKRDYLSVSPFISYDVTQRQRLDFNAYYLQADFEKQLENAQQDFSEEGVEAGWGYRFSERSSLSVHALASRYETTFDTDAYGAYLQWDTNFTENSRVYVRVGAQQTEPENGASDTNAIGGIGGSWNNQRNTLFLDLTRTVEPVSAGTVVERYQLRMRIHHDVSPRIALMLGARASHDDSIDPASTFATRKYVAAEGGFEWRVLRDFAVTATYSYRWQEYADELSDRSANGFLVGFVYEPRRLN